jgi:hypothetical protein
MNIRFAVLMKASPLDVSDEALGRLAMWAPKAMKRNIICSTDILSKLYI